MSFRKEEKLKVHFSQTLKLLDWVVSNGGKELFPERIVSSTYFDTDKFAMFRDSEEGTIPRKKIRLRSYHKNQHMPHDTRLEIKYSSVEGRFKTSEFTPQVDKLIEFGIIDNSYGLCLPKVRVSYKRAYYQLHDVRLTIDRSIEFRALDSRSQSNQLHTTDDIAVEIKASMGVPLEYLMNKFPFERVRFSKYSLAILRAYSNLQYNY